MQEEKQNSIAKRKTNVKTKRMSVGTNTDMPHFEIQTIYTNIISEPEIQTSKDILMVSRGTSPIPLLPDGARFHTETRGSIANTDTIIMTSRGTSPLGRFSKDSRLASETDRGSNDCRKCSSSIAYEQKASNEILDVSNGLILNELYSMSQTKIAKILQSIVPEDYTDLKGKGN